MSAEDTKLAIDELEMGQGVHHTSIKELMGDLNSEADEADEADEDVTTKALAALEDIRSGKVTCVLVDDLDPI